MSNSDQDLVENAAYQMEQIATWLTTLEASPIALVNIARALSAILNRNAASEHKFKDTNRHLVEVPDSFAIARWSRDADVATIARCILGTLKYEPHTADITVLRRPWKA